MTIPCEFGPETPEVIDSLYTDYSDQDIDYSYPISFKKRNRSYLKMNVSPLGEWHYGDSLEIEFYIAACDKNYLQDQILEITFYNFRHEEVYTTSAPVGEYVLISIDEDSSKEYFNKGNYFMAARLLEPEYKFRTTILDEEDCILYVK